MRKNVKVAVDSNFASFYPLEPKTTLNIKVSTKWGSKTFLRYVSIEVPSGMDDVKSDGNLKKIRGVRKEMEDNIILEPSARLTLYTDVSMMACDVCQIGLGKTDYPDGEFEHTYTLHKVKGFEMCDACFESYGGLKKEEIEKVIKKEKKE